MKPKKIIQYIVLMVVVFLFSEIKIHAEPIKEVETIQEVQIGKQQSDLTEANEQEILSYGMELIDWQSIKDLEDELAYALPDDVSFDVKQEMENLISGKTQFSLEQILSFILKILVGEMGVFVQFGARFILVVLLCNLLQTLSTSFKSKEITKVAFFVCYMVILLSVVQSFKIMIDLAMTLIDQVTRVMMVCIPILLAFMATSGLNLSAGAMAPVIISALHIMTYLMKIILLPCIVSVVVLEVMNAMSQEIKVDKLIGLFYKWIKWALVTILSISMGLLGLYRLTLPGVDMTLKKATLKLSGVFLPVVGKSINETVDFVAQCAMVIKNTFAGSVMIFILMVVSIPMIKILSYTIIYEVASAVIEPIGDKKMASIAAKLSKGCKCVMSCVGIIVLFSLASLMICMTITASGL